MHVCPECGDTYGEGGYCPKDGKQLTVRGDDNVLGVTIGAYRVASLLGVGGMGRVYKGVHPTIGSRVAIKVLSRDCVDNPGLVERFFAEARAVNLIRHENIVNVLDLDSLPDGRPYIVMEYLDGAPLSSVIHEHRRLPLGTLARLTNEVLDALSAAHDKGIVHRDLKPDNIFVTPQGRAKVLDFGIAKLRPELSGRAGPTRTGSLLGTPHYMSPEQALAQGIDHRTDLYAVGVILFEGATGNKPFSSESLFDLLRQHVDEPPPPPRSLRPDMPPAYEAVILRALAKDPAQRHESAAALARELGQATSALPQSEWTHVGGGSPRTAASIGPTPVPGGPQPNTSPSAYTPPPATPQPQAPPPHGQPSWALDSTVSGSSGQVHRGVPERPRRTGMWLALGALAVLAVAATAIVVATAGSDEGDEVAAARDGESEGEGDGDGESEGDGESAGDAGPADLADLARAAEDLRKMGKDAEQALQDGIESTNEALEDFSQRLGGKAAARGDDDDDDDSSAKVAGAAARPPRLPGTYRPNGFDASKFDVSAFVPEAVRKARAYYDDAVLVRVDANGVYPSGLADLTLSDRFYVNYTFVSPSRAKRPANLPRGVEHEPNCKFYVWVDANGVRPYPLDGWTCDEKRIGIPTCNLRQVWKAIIAKGAPAQNAVAQMGYYEVGGKAWWYVNIADEFSGRVADRCN